MWFRQGGKRKYGGRVTTSFKLTSLTLIQLTRIPFAVHKISEKIFMNFQNVLPRLEMSLVREIAIKWFVKKEKKGKKNKVENIDR